MSGKRLAVGGEQLAISDERLAVRKHAFVADGSGRYEYTLVDDQPCPNCKEIKLYQRDGGPIVVCHGCLKDFSYKNGVVSERTNVFADGRNKPSEDILPLISAMLLDASAWWYRTKGEGAAVSDERLAGSG